jgi:hypothetical protein
MITALPTGPRAGARPVMVGVRTTVKAVTLAVVPVGVTTVTGPLAALDGTVTVSCVDELPVMGSQRPGRCR